MERVSQWGHGFVAVERWPSSAGTVSAHESQWGHGFVAVESKTEAEGCGFLGSQWGHGFVAVERLGGSRSTPGQYRCRNGATAL